MKYNLSVCADCFNVLVKIAGLFNHFGLLFKVHVKFRSKQMFLNCTKILLETRWRLLGKALRGEGGEGKGPAEGTSKSKNNSKTELHCCNLVRGFMFDK